MSNRNRSLNSLGDIEFAVKRIEELEAKLAKAVEGERERCAKIADKCQRENGPLSKKGFNEQYRRGLETAGQAIAAAIRAELTGGKDE